MRVIFPSDRCGCIRRDVATQKGNDSGSPVIRNTDHSGSRSSDPRPSAQAVPRVSDTARETGSFTRRHSNQASSDSRPISTELWASPKDAARAAASKRSRVGEPSQFFDFIPLRKIRGCAILFYGDQKTPRALRGAWPKMKGTRRKFLSWNSKFKYFCLDLLGQIWINRENFGFGCNKTAAARVFLRTRSGGKGECLLRERPSH